MIAVMEIASQSAMKIEILDTGALARGHAVRPGSTIV